MGSDPSEKNRLLRTFLPSKLELIFIPIASTLFLLISTGIARARSADAENYTLVTEFIEVRLRSALRLVDELAGQAVLTLLFWMFVGLIVYVLVWFSIEAYKAYQSDLPVTSGMVLPRGHKSSDALHESIARLSLRFISTVLFFVWIYKFFTSALPYVSELFVDNSYSISSDSLVNLGLSVIALSGSVFLIFVLTRCMMLRDRVFNY